MDCDEIVKIIAASATGIVLIIAACFAGARASLCSKIKCSNFCCNLEVERQVAV